MDSSLKQEGQYPISDEVAEKLSHISHGTIDTLLAPSRNTKEVILEENFALHSILSILLPIGVSVEP